MKKRSTDTLRLQKKARKSGKADDLQKALQDVSEKKSVLEETEKKAIREALVEERSRYCLFVTFLKPVVVSIPLFILFFFTESGLGVNVFFHYYRVYYFPLEYF